MRNRQRTGSNDEPARRVAVPAARTDQLIRTELGRELVVYDQVRHHIHHLDRNTTAVLQHCDGRRTVPELAQLAHPTLDSRKAEAAVFLALPELEAANLLAQPLDPALQVSPQSRRDLLRRLGKAALAPAIFSMTAAEASASQSPVTPDCQPNQWVGCTSSGECCSGCCSQFGSTCVERVQAGTEQSCKP